jgi:hypothetical protein
MLFVGLLWLAFFGSEGCVRIFSGAVCETRDRSAVSPQ